MAHFLTDSGEVITFEGSITFRMLNPMFEKMNTHSMPVNIPATVENSIILNRPELINSVNNKIREINVTYIGSLHHLIGILRINIPNNGFYKGYFIGQNAFLRSFQDKKLNEIEYDIIDYPSDILNQDFSSSDIEDFILQIDSERAYSFIPHFNYNRLANFNLKEDTFPPEIPLNLYINADDYYYLSAENPHFLLSFIISQISKKAGISVDLNLFNDNKFKYLFLYNNQLITTYSFSEYEDLEYDILKIEVIDEETLRFHTGLTDENGDLITGVDHGLGGSYIYFKFEDLPTLLGDLNERVFYSDDIDEPYYFDLKGIDTGRISNMQGNLGKYIIMSIDFDPLETFEIGKHFPNCLISEFTEHLKTDFGIILFPDESKKHLHIKLKKDILISKEVIDITNYTGKLTDLKLNEYTEFNIVQKPTEEDDFYSSKNQETILDYIIKDSISTLNDLPLNNNNSNDIRFVNSEQAFFIWQSNNYGLGTRGTGSLAAANLEKWKYYSKYLDILNENADFIIEFSFAPIPGYIYYFQSIAVYCNGNELPRIDIAANSLDIDEITDPGLRYLILTINENNPIGTDHNEYLNLSLHNDNNIYDILLKYYIDWMINRYREAISIINWPAHLFQSFAWWKKYRVKDTNYLVKEINYSENNSGKITWGKTKLARV